MFFFLKKCTTVLWLLSLYDLLVLLLLALFVYRLLMLSYSKLTRCLFHPKRPPSDASSVRRGSSGDEWRGGRGLRWAHRDLERWLETGKKKQPRTAAASLDSTGGAFAVSTDHQSDLWIFWAGVLVCPFATGVCVCVSIQGGDFFNRTAVAVPGAAPQKLSDCIQFHLFINDNSP